MTNTTIYGSVLISRTGLPVPVFHNGHAMHSRYDPVKEAEQTAARIQAGGGLFLIAGIGCGYLLRALRSRYPECVILAAENSSDDIDFLGSFSPFQEIRTDGRIIIFPVAQTGEMLLRYYMPGVYGSLNIIEQQSWITENPSGAAAFREQTAAASKIISADFSVQAHFGKIWQRNILMNLKNAGTGESFRFPVNKTALIAAAGPSLDLTASYISQNRHSLYVIATDTAFGSFCRRGIRCDAVVSIDGQEISHNHFTAPGGLTGDTLFVFDLCANPAAVRAVRKSGGKMLFVHTGHPLSQYAAQSLSSSFLQLDAGSGTVTVAAADFALKAGFSKITVAGADFAYLNGKAYMKGTYLDGLYNKESTRLSPAETVFDRLLFRTPLIQCRNRTGTYTTDVLGSYDASFEQWAAVNGLYVERKDLLKICCARQPVHTLFQSAAEFDFPLFIKKLTADFSAVRFETLLPGAFPPILLALLPAASAYGTTDHSTVTHGSFPERVNLAYSEILRYTQTI